LQHEGGDHRGESARRNDGEDDQRDGRRCDRDEGNDEQDAADDHE